MTATLNKRFYAALAASIGHLKGEQNADAKADIIRLHTKNAKSSAADLTDAEALEIIIALERAKKMLPLVQQLTEMGVNTGLDTEAEKCNTKRRKLCGMAHNVGWVVWCATKGAYKADMPRLYGWVKQYGHLAPKALNEYTSKELNKLITQFGQVQKSELKK